MLKLHKTLALPTLLYGSEIDFEQHKWKIYGEQQVTLFLTTKEKKKF
jgi:hypothetical protein